jgi:UDP-glucose 4-epimerase
MRYLRNGGNSDVFNLGNSVGHSVLEVAQSVQRVTGREVPVEFAPRRPGDADRLVASSEKARRILKWNPARASIDTIIRDAWDWRCNHPAGYAE